MLWEKLTHRHYGLFDLLNRHASATQDAAQNLVTIAEEWPEAAGHIRRVEELEHECDSIAHMTIDLLHRTFITPLDRDETVRLIVKMDDVMDSIERVAKRMLLFEIGPLPWKLQEMIRVVKRGQDQVAKAVGMIRGFKNTEQLREILKEINRLENEGDGLHHAGLSELFREYAGDPLTVIKLKEIYETIELAIDQCEDIANIVERIVLEHF